VTEREFRELVEAALGQIPARFRRRLQNVAFVVEADSPGGRLLGLHESQPPLPDRITIYQRPHEAEARGDRAALKQLVLETVLHEVGHALGLSEAEVRAMERARRRRWQRGQAPWGLFPRGR